MYYSIIVFLVLAVLIVFSIVYFAFKLERKSPFSRRIHVWLYKIPFIQRKYGTLKKFERSMFKGVREFFRETFVFLENKALVFVQMAIELLVYLLRFYAIYLLFRALGVDVPFVLVLVVSAVSEMIGFLFISPGGLGAVEGSMVGLFYLFGINAEVVVAVTVINRIIIYAYEFIGGYVSFLYLKSRFR